MTTDVATVGPDTPFKAVVVLLASWNISGAPVVDDAGKLVGVVTLNGTVERTSMIQAIGALIRRVDGVGEIRQTCGASSTTGAFPGPAGTGWNPEPHRPHRPHN